MSASESSSFKSGDFALRAQKKILSQLSSRKAAKVFINENLSELLDLLYQLIKVHSGDKKKAEKFVKNIIKLSIKIGILMQNDQFTPDEMSLANKFSARFSTIAKTIASFTEVDFTYDRGFLLNAVNECEGQMVTLLQNHLTDKSIGRVQAVAATLRDTTLLDNAFCKGSSLYPITLGLVYEINRALDAGDL